MSEKSLSLTRASWRWPVPVHLRDSNNDCKSILQMGYSKELPPSNAEHRALVLRVQECCICRWMDKSVLLCLCKKMWKKTDAETRQVSPHKSSADQLLIGSNQEAASDLAAIAPTQQSFRRQSRARGCRIVLVGGGKGTRLPCSKSMGLYSSGTASCITGLLR